MDDTPPSPVQDNRSHSSPALRSSERSMGETVNLPPNSETESSHGGDTVESTSSLGQFWNIFNHASYALKEYE